MRAGRLATRRYKTRGGKVRRILLLIVGIGLGFAGANALRGGTLPPLTKIAAEPVPTLPPEETQADERTLTLSGQSWYALQLGVYTDEAAARQEAESYRARGAGGYILQKDGCRVLAAAYSSRADAQAVMTRLKTRHRLDCEVVEIVSPEITLKVSGQKGQLTALSDAYAAMEKLCDHLYRLSLSLDKQETGVREALAALKSEQDTLNALIERLQSRFGASAPSAVVQLKQTLSDCARSLSAASAAQTLTRLGAQVKYCHLECLCQMAAYADALERGMR
ncbi:MAG: SPOR domain-containing protein [Clostridia bacterium]|nr:SPOR domain-containing protein [Clostridia bacterium]